MNEEDRRILSFFYPSEYEKPPTKNVSNTNLKSKEAQEYSLSSTCMCLSKLNSTNLVALKQQKQITQDEKEKKIAKVKETYDNQTKERYAYSSIFEPEDGLPTKSILDKDIEYATEVYNRYTFTHNYDKNLPIFQSHEIITNTVETSPVTIVCGSTGSGKTTQIPQYILDYYREKDEHCNIVVTQPRRIAAMSVARRVCAERNWPIGQLVGYSVAHNKSTSLDTRICYVTTGVLIERIAHSVDVLDCYTHVIVDEVHERTVEIDILLLVLSRYMKEKSKNIKVILMSATLDVSLFANYFATRVGSSVMPPPVINVQGRVYNVTTFYSGEFDFLNHLPQGGNFSDAKPDFSEQMKNLIINIILNIDTFEKIYKIDCDKNRSSILVFLPGVPEVEALHEQLLSENKTKQLIIRSLHSQISTDDQAQIFRKCESGWRKIIFATNVAESSITVPDIKYVIDTCLHKQIECDRTIGLSCLKLNWISKSSGSQRQGRAGRVSEGYCFRLVNRDFYNNFEDFDSPEMIRSPLEQILLKVKKLELGPPILVLQAAISPPSFTDLEKAILVLKEIGALTLNFNGSISTLDGDLSFLGMVLSNLPIDVRLGKFLFLSNILGLLDEAVVIAGMMSVRSIFTEQAGNELDAYVYMIYVVNSFLYVLGGRNRMQKANESFSDHIVFLEIYREYQKQRATPSFDENKRLWSRSNFISLKSLREADDVIGELFKRLQQMQIKPHTQLLNRSIIDKPREVFLLKLALAGAFYPYYFTSGILRFDDISKQYQDKDIFNSVMITGVNRRADYAQQVVKYFKDFSRIKKITTESSRCYVEFEKPSISSFDCNPSVFVAIKKKRLYSIINRNGESDKKLAASNNRDRYKKSFNGPYSPLELAFSFHPHLLSSRSIKINRSSVNSVSLYLHNKHNLQYTYVGTDVTTEYGGNSIKVMYSTAFPPFVGLGELLVLLFSPNGEYRIDRNERRITGAICGLGLDSETQQPLLAENDVEIYFPFNFTKKDALEINNIREMMNLLLSSDQGLNENLVNHFKIKLRQELISVFEKVRIYQEPDYDNSSYALTYRWNVLPEYQLGPEQSEDIKLDQLLDQLWSIATFEASSEEPKRSFSKKRIREIMNHNRKGIYISENALKLMDKACEMFIQEIGLKCIFFCNDTDNSSVDRIHVITTMVRDNQYAFLIDDHSNDVDEK